ncbi:hypothetical protein JXA56_02080 [Candidatus Micrarchaeota archaeon]|nr:hypothetical protein [Candidatus Micrarchaeota archaeon]
MIEKTKKEGRDIQASVKRNVTALGRKAVLASSIMLIAACGSREESKSSDNASGGSSGVAGTGTGGQTESGGTAGQTESGGTAGSGGTTCPISARYNVDCESTSSISATMEVNEEMKIGTENGAISLRLAGVVGRNFEVSQWYAYDETCADSNEEITEGTSKIVAAGSKRVDVTVHEIAPDTSDGKIKVTTTFSAVCGNLPVVDGGAGASGEGCGAVQEEGQEATFNVGDSVTVGNVTFELVSTSTVSAVVAVSCTDAVPGEITVNAGSVAGYDLETHEAEVENIWSNPVQARLKPSVNNK